MKLFTWFDRPEKVLEKGGGPSKTEQAGYIPPAVQIGRMLQAGERLREARREEFQGTTDEELDAAAVLPQNRPGYDLADATAELRQVRETMTARLEARAKEKKAAAEKAAAEAAAAELLAKEAGEKPA